jgi:CheY-like chemotaxis protein
MAHEKPRVIVIDDDEVVLVAISDLLEDVGCEVFTQTSPIGATQVIVREGINAAVIDINLPVMQGDNVIRLFRSWDKVKDLPIVVVSGASSERLAAIQRELPGIRIVRKDEMQERLASTVLEVLAGARGTRASRATPSTPTPTDTRPRSNELQQRIAHDLGQLMAMAHEVWKEAREGHLERIPPMTESLTRLRGQAQLLGLEKVALLTMGLSEVFVALKHGRRLGRSVDKNVEHAIAALAALKASPGCVFAFSPDPLTRSLRESITET